MNSLRSTAVIVFFSYMASALYAVSDSPDIINDYFTLFGGRFDNFDQDKEEGGKHDQIQIIMKPIYVYSLNKGPVMYTEESINGAVYRMFVLNVTKIPDSRFITLAFFNFTEDPTKYKSESFDPDCLTNLGRDKFYSIEGCVGSYEELSRGIFYGKLADCRHTINGQHPSYSATVSCDGIRLEIPLASKETTTTLRYYLKLRPPRFQLKVIPEGFESPCKDKQ